MNVKALQREIRLCFESDFGWETFRRCGLEFDNAHAETMRNIDVRAYFRSEVVAGNEFPDLVAGNDMRDYIGAK